MYHLIGKQVSVNLYSRDGIMLGELRGRVADVARAVEVAPDMRKDLAYVVNIEPLYEGIPYVNSAGTEGEGWFAVQDLVVIDDDHPTIFFN